MKSNFKIAKILDEYSVIVNAGTDDGIEVGDQFQILDKKGSAVKDPDTGATIGHLDLIKGTINVSEVQEKMCICTSPNYVSIPATSLLSSIRDITEALPVSSRREKLNVDLDQVTGGLRKSDAPIQVGDSVKLIKSATKRTKV